MKLVKGTDNNNLEIKKVSDKEAEDCLLYTSDAADD